MDFLLHLGRFMV
ncbi:hypothetical protein OIU84_016929, partial [Salix udensis]